VPVIVDAGVGTASDACIAMELGAAGVLMNTGVAGANDPIRMARDAAGDRRRTRCVSRGESPESGTRSRPRRT
jgi:thiazole synthase ThiGH ThiG subunit